MIQLVVVAAKLNKRTFIPKQLPEPLGISGTINKGFTFVGEEVLAVPNPSLGKWYMDAHNNYYWGGALRVVSEDWSEPENLILDGTSILNPDGHTKLEVETISVFTKSKIERVINAFETGKAEGDYSKLVKLADHLDSVTGIRRKQITYGRSQTTEYGNLKELVLDYVNSAGTEAGTLRNYIDRIGIKNQPSLESNSEFCEALIRAGKNDPIMKTCQDRLFENKYYQPAFSWFKKNGFKLPLSLLVIYDSYIHSGSMLKFLCARVVGPMPVTGGTEKEWILAYANARFSWLSTHKEQLLRNTAKRPKCYLEQMKQSNWQLQQPILANGINII